MVGQTRNRRGLESSGRFWLRGDDGLAASGSKIPWLPDFIARGASRVKDVYVVENGTGDLPLMLDSQSPAVLKRSRCNRLQKAVSARARWADKASSVARSSATLGLLQQRIPSTDSVDGLLPTRKTIRNRRPYSPSSHNTNPFSYLRNKHFPELYRSNDHDANHRVHHAHLRLHAGQLQEGCSQARRR